MEKATQYIFTFAYEEEDHPKIAVNPESGYIKNSGLVTVGPSTPASVMPPDDDVAEQEIEAAISAIADKHKEAIDNAHFNIMALNEAKVVVKNGKLVCERVKFEGDKDGEGN